MRGCDSRSSNVNQPPDLPHGLAVYDSYCSTRAKHQDTYNNFQKLNNICTLDMGDLLPFTSYKAGPTVARPRWVIRPLPWRALKRYVAIP